MNDLDLIQRFRADVPAPDDERSRAARARLLAEVCAADAQTKRRPDHNGQAHHGPRPALALRVGLPAAVSLAAAAASAIVLLGGGVSGSGTSTADAAIIHHADVAFAAPPNEVFHSKLQGDGFVAESWQLTSAPYSYLRRTGPIGAAPYASDDGSTAAYYDPTTNTIHQTRSTKPAAPDDPLTEIRQELQDGRARVLSTATVDGAATYEIQLADKDGFDAQSLIVYVDRGSYRPIEIADPQRNGTTVHLRVVAFEYLPATPANMNLLSLTARYPNAHVVSDSAAAAASIK
jgi:hypothetical protein